MNIPTLRSGGLITNYYCSSSCKHCAYFCGPRWSRRYIDEATARRVLAAIKRQGCNSIHIGGGEPFLNRAGLIDVAGWCSEERVAVEYIETNAGWINDEDDASKTLHSLMELGIHTLLVSMSPFHNEFIPWRKTKSLVALCKKLGMSVFPWVEEFAGDIGALPENVPHRIDEYEELFGPGYLENLPSRYWISMRGRAVETYKSFHETLRAEDIVASWSDPCTELLDTSHFHVDLFGNYIPGICSGLAIDVDDLDVQINSQRYQFFTTLMEQGIGGLYGFAVDKFGYTAKDGYFHKCELCYDIRRHIAFTVDPVPRDISPVELYAQMS